MLNFNCKLTTEKKKIRQFRKIYTNLSTFLKYALKNQNILSMQNKIYLTYMYYKIFC